VSQLGREDDSFWHDFFSPRQILDYAQYYLDLPEANKLGKAEWKLEYNFTQYYDLSITPKNLHELAESFVSPQGYSWFEK